jgi:hypothetical protein
METKTTLALWKKISACIADEISSNEEFAEKMGGLLLGDNSSLQPKKSNRRPPAKIDPFTLYEQGDDKLAKALSMLNIEELKDVIAANGMDAAKLAMKWKNRSRLEKHIIEATQRRSSRGEAFWNTSEKSAVTGDGEN